MEEGLKKTLFIRVMAAMEAYRAAVAVDPSSAETRIRHERFCAIWDVIEDARLDEDYQRWKEG